MIVLVVMPGLTLQRFKELFELLPPAFIVRPKVLQTALRSGRGSDWPVVVVAQIDWRFCTRSWSSVLFKGVAPAPSTTHLVPSNATCGKKPETASKHIKVTAPDLT
jgi:hypothetical protein